MAKLIFTSRYLKDAKPSQKENYVHYIGTRKGVEKIDTSKKHLPATVSQKKLVHQLLQDFPATKEMLEYEDYQRKPTIENASEFISCALEQNLDIAATRKNYVDYLAHRPRVEKIGEHGLFTDEGEPVVLGQVQNQVADHKGIVWTHVISLRREDAARLGYDSAVQWMALLRSKRAMLCKHMKIDSANLKWYAAFHNESHHPHVHLLVYSVKDGEGYLTKQSIEAMRSELAHDIFRQDFANIYEEQAQSRMDLKERSEVVMKTWIDEIRAGTLKSSEIETSMMQLSKRLQNTGGKKVYGYLKRDVKDLVDHIVDELEKDDRVSALYREWGLWQDEIVKTYRKQTEELPPLSKQPKLKSIKNMVIAEALRLGSHHFLFEENEDGYSEPKDDFFIQEPDPVAELTGELDSDYAEEELKQELFPNGRKEKSSSNWWTDGYIQARNYLYGSDSTLQDFEKAYQKFLQEAEQGNPYASLELAKMYRDGFCTEPDLQQAEWRFQNAYSGFVVLEEKSHDDKLQYRIGQMLHTGTGTSKDDEGAARYWEKSAKLGNINAQYALGTLWLETGSGDSGQAVEWLTKAATAEHSAAQYVLGKLYQDGVYFNKDMDQAMKWFRSAAELGNEYAAYRMGCLLLLGEEIPKDVEAAVKWLSLSAEKGNPYAQYRLGMLYLKGEVFSPQVEVAMKWLQQAAEQKNEWAFYQLGKLYLSGEHVTKNVETAVHYLGLCAEKGNQYAQYVLGKLYLCGRDVSCDWEKAVEYLTASAEQGNLYASFLLEHLDAYQDPSLFLAATRLLHHLEKLFCEEVQRPMEMKRYQIDRKRRRKLSEKKQAQGHHRDDQEPAQGIY